MQCLLCHKTITPKVIVDNLSSDYNQKDKTAYRYLQCPSCEIVFINPFPKIKALENDVYNETYFDWGTIHWYQKFIYNLYLYKDFPRWVESEVSRKEEILDIGCGGGEFMMKMKRLGWNVFGSEVNKPVIKKLKKIFGENNIYDIGKNDLQKVSNKFSIITFWHVVEHLEQPLETLRLYRKTLKKDGKVFIEVPNASSWVFKIFGPHYTWLRIPDHVFYYSPQTLQNVLLKSGFRNIIITSPMKANLNLSMNIYNMVLQKFGKQVALLILFLSLPFSIFFSFLASIFHKGEVIRATATYD